MSDAAQESERGENRSLQPHFSRLTRLARVELQAPARARRFDAALG